MNNKTKRAGQKRRQMNKRLSKYYAEFYEMIDGNYTHYPVAFCTRYKGYVTKSMADVHRCACHNSKGNACGCYISMERIEKGEYKVCSMQKN